MTTKINGLKQTAAGFAREAIRLLILITAAIVIGVIGTLVLDVGSTTHYVFVALLMIITAILA